MDKFPDQCYELKIPALTEDSPEGVSTCEDLYPTEDLQQKRETLDEEIWGANYMQVPVDKKGALYGEFKTYDVLDPDKFEKFLNYTDTADEGADSLCSISGGQIGRYGYVTDIYYTDEPMEVTEPETARRLQAAGVQECLIESNNGGRGFARNVIRHLKELHCHKCSVTWFHQSKNKRTRILTNASNVMEQVIMPSDWKQRWPDFAQHVSRYQRKGKNDHDDAEDALTGFVELLNGDVKGKRKARVGKKESAWAVGGDMYKFRRDQVLDPEFLTKLVERFKKEYVPRFIRDQQYYEVKTEILKRTMTDGKPNNRLAHGFCRYITNMATSYFAGKPLGYIVEDNEYQEALENLFQRNYIDSLNFAVSKEASKKGIDFC